ncbi:MAG: hypothetical protein KC636_25790 [Myxococcales bacterium]|nr:hypothetical protein [Myxococcales bacterium]
MASLIPLSRVASSLALSFTGQPAPAPAGDATAAQPVVPAPEEPASMTTEAPAMPTEAPATTQATATAPAQPPAVANQAPVYHAPLERDDPIPGQEAAEAAEADARVASRRVLRPTDRRLFFTLFVGPSRPLASYSYGSDFKLEAALGGHSKRRPTLGGSFVFQAAFGVPTFKRFTFAPRLNIDKQIVPQFPIYFNVGVMAGYRIFLYYSDGYHQGMVGLSWGASLILAERLLLSFRPLNLDVSFPQIAVHWDVMAGLGVVW